MKTVNLWREKTKTWCPVPVIRWQWHVLRDPYKTGPWGVAFSKCKGGGMLQIYLGPRTIYAGRYK